jgi:PTH1 family peptidyl-tRNA hydrolase
MQSKKVRLVVGLGNPGDTYKKTRHNTGYMVLDEVADFFSITVEKSRPFSDLVYGRGLIDGIHTILAKPTSFMNRSGPPVQRIADYYRILCEEMLVIHDDIDLAFGRLKIKKKGGDGGHKGVRSLIQALGRDEFIRLRIGVGRSEEKIDTTDHVLGRFKPEEKEVLGRIIIKAREAVVTILTKGTEEGMNRFHDKRIIIDS